MAQTTGKKKVFFTLGGSPEDKFTGTKVASTWSPGGRSRTRFVRLKSKKNVNVQYSSKTAHVCTSAAIINTVGTASRFSQEVSTIRTNEIRVDEPRF